ncbi:hypothetical protein Tco_1502261 [Tanacetum coccineum]
MAPKRATRSNIALETTNTTSVTNDQLQAMINQGVTATLAARDADRNTNGDDSHISEAVENQVKFATCTLYSVALKWWNTHVKTVGHDAAHGVTAALAARDADRNTNGDDSHISGAGVRRAERTARECTYTDFLNVNH